jgi:hypothetical protein
MSKITIDLIWDELQRDQPPQGTTPEAWCYDLLLGAAVALTRAKTFPTAPPNSYETYRKPSELRRLEGNTYEAFAWGFSLHSAIHRVVWAMERLLRLRTQMDRPADRFPSVLGKARAICGQGTPALAKILSQFSVARVDLRTTNVTESNVLHVLYERVNRQKHWGTRAAGEPNRGPKDESAPWGEISGDRQHQLVLHALKLVTALYWESYPKSGLARSSSIVTT